MVEEEITVEKLERMYEENLENDTPRMLPVVEIDGEHWWVDGNLREVRSVNDIDKRMAFDEFQHEGPDIVAMKHEKVEKEESDY